MRTPSWCLLVSVSILLLAAVGCGGPGQSQSAPASAKLSASAAESAPADVQGYAAKAKWAPSEASPAAVPVSLQSRKVIQTAHLVVQVGQVRDAERKLKRMVLSAGGYVESSTADGNGRPEPTISLTARIPVNQFDAVLEGAQGLGTVQTRQVGSEDVTGAIVDAEARLRAMRAQERAYESILTRARKVSEVLEVESRLAEVRGRIESLDGQRKMLESQAALSTLSVSLEPAPVANAPAKDPNWIKAAWAAGTNTLADFTRSLVSILIYQAALAPLWLVLLGGGALIWRSRKRRIVTGPSA